MKLHIFNPEHDIALALNKTSFTPSHNVMKMRRELAFLPSLWADDGDLVLVEDINYARKAASHLSSYTKDVRFITLDDLKSWNRDKAFRESAIQAVEPWGWDKAIVHTLKQAGVSSFSNLPDLSLLYAIRNASHRRTAMNYLEQIDSPFKAYEVTTVQEIAKLLELHRRIVLKSPWSCSGRGVRFMDGNSSQSIFRWAENIVQTQGSIMVEPFYDKLQDFAVEFFATDNGISCCGLSVFQTYFTSYSASLIATEEEKWQIITRHIAKEELTNIINVSKEYLSSVISPHYRGGIGIDMMIVKDADNGCFLLHPCVEINLRRTMGHTALSFPTSPTIPKKLMVIDFDRNFELKIKSI